MTGIALTPEREEMRAALRKPEPLVAIIDATDKVLNQVASGMGLIRVFPAKRFCRDVRHYRAGGGAFEIQRRLIPPDILNKPR